MNRYSQPITYKSNLVGEHVNLLKIRDDFSDFLRKDRRNGMYDSEMKNYYQYHMKMNQLQSLDNKFKLNERMFENQGLKHSKVIEVEPNERQKYDVESIKIHVYRDDSNNQKVMGGVSDSLSVSLGYLPSDNELTVTEVKFKPYIR